ncbi:hypothetical protein ACHMW6_10455 [Pseudoduganella sp. UC29_106]|uniref:hypothetical protein n=1 Tax=Pseudoduganella sp. UC29_106 TaxID=3374553 RepID=UPI0037568F81
MMKYAIALFFMLNGAAQAVTQEEVAAGGAALSRAHRGTAGGVSAGSDERFQARVERVVRPLIAQAMRDYPAAASFSWEVQYDAGRRPECIINGRRTAAGRR